MLLAAHDKGAHGLLGDLSFVSILATALTAATSFLLVKYIGVAGSLIGAVVASVASAVATQVYGRIIAASATQLHRAADAGTTLGGRDADEDDDYADGWHRPRGGAVADRNNGGHQARWKVVALSVAVALACVLAAAALIRWATQGQGIGPTSFDYEGVATSVDEGDAETAEAAPDEGQGVSQDTQEPTETDAAPSAEAQGEGAEDAQADGSAEGAAAGTETDSQEGAGASSDPTDGSAGSPGEDVGVSEGADGTTPPTPEGQEAAS